MSINPRSLHTTDPRIVALFDAARKSLIETGTRNRLVHVNRAASRGSFLNVVNERSDEVYPLLFAGKKLRFLALGRDTDDGENTLFLGSDTQSGPGYTHVSDASLDTRLGPDALARKLLKIAREAQTAEEESGINILYLALGFLTWFEDASSSQQREAPLVLLPVELIRNLRSSTYDVRIRDEDVVTNLPLQQRLISDFGIRLPLLEISDGWKPTDYFASVEAVVAQKPGWRVKCDEMQLGFFSFSKLLMYNDLGLDAWPAGSLAQHPLVRGLLHEGFATEPPLFGENDQLDVVLQPEDLFHVVDADASQAKVIEEVRSGRNLVVQGPPGTGKSQTITNIIAAAVQKGQTVLFVAEKMAALSVVHDRLVKVGLRDVCLELHSRVGSKNAVTKELSRTLAAAAAGAAAMQGAPAALRQARDQLNALSDSLHRPLGTTGESAFTMLARQAKYIAAGVPLPQFTTDAFDSMTRDGESEWLLVLERYSALVEAEGLVSAHPYRGVRNLGLQPVELARAALLMQTAMIAAGDLLSMLTDVASDLGLPKERSIATAAHVVQFLQNLDGMPLAASSAAAAVAAVSDLVRLRQALREGLDWQQAEKEITPTLAVSVLSVPVDALRGPIAAGATSLFKRFGRAYRNASRTLAQTLRDPLPKPAAKRLGLIDAIGAAQMLRERWIVQQAHVSKVLGEAIYGENTDLQSLASVVDWYSHVKSTPLSGSTDRMLALAAKPGAAAAIWRALQASTQVADNAIQAVMQSLDLDFSIFTDTGVSHADLESVVSRLRSMVVATDRYASWARLAKYHAELVSAGLGMLADRLRAGELSGAAAAVELKFARAEHLWRSAIQRDSVLRKVRESDRTELVEIFGRLERSRLTETVSLIRTGHLAQVPQGALGEMKIVRGEIAKQRNHLPLRKLFTLAGNAVQRIKPVLLMSPISVAQFLPPDTLCFDLLVIDEASQVRPEDALGAVARARQIVVVGDRKQLPPSSFFEKLSLNDGDIDSYDSDEDGADLLAGAASVAEMESILTLCEARGLGSRMLKWHYRSRDPSLMQVSNHEFYEDSLILPPSPLHQDPAYGLCFTRVDGVYARGGRKDNRIEGQAVVARVAEHARLHPTLSLGIIAFSVAQRTVIEELLEAARRSDAVLDAFLQEGQHEKVFVKNIETVQGDERDVILVSVGYGPVIAGGRLSSMSFGPVNGQGGERRLNVLFTRARVRCEVFASFDPGDMDVSRTGGAGPRILKRFLDFAKNGSDDLGLPTGAMADSPLEEDVADVVRSFGFLADPQVGSVGFRIDMGIRHPDRPGVYILALECDGATYHSALWARERDRLRQDVLENLGWRFHRIWSTDWFYARAKETDRLRQALFAARDAAEKGIRVDGANSARSVMVEDSSITPPAELKEQRRTMPPYKRAVLSVSTGREPHEAPLPMIADLARRVVVAEGPVHVEEIAQRIASSFGKGKAGSRIMIATRSALATLQGGPDGLICDHAFWFTSAQMKHPPVRDRSGDGAMPKAENLSILEIRAALEIARSDNAGGGDADLIQAAARLMGFRRVGSKLQARITAGL